MKRFPFLLLALVISVKMANAQAIPIQGTSQKTSYLSQSEWPFISAQGHWAPGNSMIFNGDTSLLNQTVSHVHVECSAPVYGEIAHNINFPCQVQLFHLAGRVITAQNFPGGLITWQSVGVPQQDQYDVPLMQGNPMGLVKFPFTLSIDPIIWDSNPHGWVTTRTTIDVAFDNGSFIDTTLTMPFYAMLDPNAGLNPSTGDGNGPIMGTSINVGSPLDNQGAWGTIVTQSQTILPVFMVPMTEAFSYYWTAPTDEIMRGYTYAAGPNAPDGVTLARADIDLHNGSEGRAVTFGHYDIHEIGSGVHKVAMIWKEDTGSGNANFAPHETAIALLVINVNVSDGTVPIMCQDPSANNFGQPLPCTYNPPPVVNWQDISSKIQRLNDTIRICAIVDNKCTDPIVVH